MANGAADADRCPTAERHAPDRRADRDPTPRPRRRCSSCATACPPLVDTDEPSPEICEALAGGTGPVAIDAERASGYRYSSRAYLIQLRREGAGTFLVDPIAFDSLAPLQEAHRGHRVDPPRRDPGPALPHRGRARAEPRSSTPSSPAACSAIPGSVWPPWSRRCSGSGWRRSTPPSTGRRGRCPEPWLEYAALDVEVLVELRDLLAAELVEAGKDEWARQEFDAPPRLQPAPRVDAWRRTSGLHRVRGRRALGAVRALWETRDEIAEQRDVTPGRIIPDSAIVAAATAMPADRAALLATKGFHGRGAERYAGRWVAALQRGRRAARGRPPTRAPRGDGPPMPRAWAEKDPVAARRLSARPRAR